MKKLFLVLSVIAIQGMAIAQTVQVITLPQWFRDSSASSYFPMRFLKVHDTVKVFLDRELAGDYFSFLLKGRGVGRLVDSLIGIGIATMNRTNDTIMSAVMAYANGTIKLRIRDSVAIKVDSGQTQILNTLLVGPGFSIVLPPQNWGVTQIDAGVGIIISPIPGLGEVTVSADTASLVLRKDSSITYPSWKQFRDSSAQAVKRRDSSSVYPSYAAFRDSSFKNLKIRDSSSYTAWARFRDSLLTVVMKTRDSGTYTSRASFRDSLYKFIHKTDSSFAFTTPADLRDSLYKFMNRTGLGQTYVAKTDSGSIYMSWPQGRDSAANARARYVWKPDSGVTYASYPAFRDSLAKVVKQRDSTIYATWPRLRDTTQALRNSINGKQASGTYVIPSDTTILHNEIIADVRIKDTTTAASGSYVTPTQIAVDTTNRNVLLALKWAKADTASAPGVPSINRVLDSLAHIRTSMNGIGGGGGGALVARLNGDVTSVSSSYADVTGASVSVAANSTYTLAAAIYIGTSPDGGNSLMRWVVPSGTTISGVRIEKQGASWSMSATVQTNIFGAPSGSYGLTIISATLKTSGTAGTVKWQIADDDDVTTTTLYSYSNFYMVKQ